jgi:(p)ppGpp synthase/HD superfamily hydrolase
MIQNTDLHNRDEMWAMAPSIRPFDDGRVRRMFSTDRYTEALRFAAERHHAQRVPDSELPYLVHVVSVAAEVIAALPTASIADPDLAVTCALLHDTVEDTATNLDELAVKFGAAVAAGVAALTKNHELPKAEQMADSLRRIKAQPPEIAMVKLADRITNLAPPPPHWTKDKCAAYREEAIVIADVLGYASAALHERIRARIATY